MTWLCISLTKVDQIYSVNILSTIKTSHNQTNGLEAGIYLINNRLLSDFIWAFLYQLYL